MYCCLQSNKSWVEKTIGSPSSKKKTLPELKGKLSPKKKKKFFFMFSSIFALQVTIFLPLTIWMFILMVWFMVLIMLVNFIGGEN